MADVSSGSCCARGGAGAPHSLLHALEEAELSALGAREDGLRVHQTLRLLLARLGALRESALDPVAVRLDLLEILERRVLLARGVRLRVRVRLDLRVRVRDGRLEVRDLVRVRLVLRLRARRESEELLRGL